MQLWAGVSFTAMGGQTATFLQRAAQKEMKLRHIRPLLGGVSAQCSARRYLALRKIARPCRVKLQITARHGVYFVLRGLFNRKGLWAGVLAFALLASTQRNLIWQIDDSDLTTGQQARVAALLWEECGIAAGAYYSEELLAQGETVLLSASDEFSWVSLNFAGGRLTVEVTAATAVPEIAEGTLGDITASVAGEIVSVNVGQGTPVVSAGQMVEAGDVLIAAARLEHDGETLVYEPTAGEVLAQFSVSYSASLATVQQVNLPTEPLGIETDCSLYAFGKVFDVPNFSDVLDGDRWRFFASDTPLLQLFGLGAAESAGNLGQDAEMNEVLPITTTRNVQLSWFGFALPVTILEENTLYYTEVDIIYTQEELYAMARLACSEQLYADYPDAEIVGYRENIIEEGDVFALTVEYQIVADICSSLD